MRKINWLVLAGISYFSLSPFAQAKANDTTEKENETVQSQSVETETKKTKIELTIEGLDGELEDNVNAYISSIPEESYSVSRRFKSNLTEKITEALKALGYYNPKIDFKVQDTDENEKELVVNIDSGPPTIIYQSDVQIQGEAATDPDFLNIIHRSKINLGRTLNHSNYEAVKSKISSLALKKGYFDGEFKVTKLEVSPERNQALITLHYNSGPRYKFGETNIKGSQIEEKRVRSLLPYKAGDYYDSDKVGKLNQNLSNSSWFSSIGVEPSPADVDDDLNLPMNVYLEPESRNQVEVGLGYTTDIGIRGSLTWTKPWLNKYGHSLTTSLEVSKPEKTLTASYKIPLEHVLTDYYLLQYGFKDEDNRDTDSQEQNFSVERHWLFSNGWHQNLYLRLLYEDYVQGEESGNSLFVLPGITWSRVRSKGGSMPMWGDSQSLTLEVGDPGLFSDTSVLRTQAHTAWIRGLGDSHRFLTRLDLAGTFADDWDEIPPSLRYFAGGMNSIRGYGYEAISPKDSSGELAGAKYMATSTLEYQYNFGGPWWGALFFDYGDAWTDTPTWKKGMGFGLRWASPVGPVRIDFAYGPDDGDDNYRIHFSLGPEL